MSLFSSLPRPTRFDAHTVLLIVVSRNNISVVHNGLCDFTFSRTLLCSLALGKVDDVTEELRACVHAKVALPSSDLALSQRLVAAEHLDVLVFAEVCGVLLRCCSVFFVPSWLRFTHLWHSRFRLEWIRTTTFSLLGGLLAARHYFGGMPPHRVFRLPMIPPHRLITVINQVKVEALITL